MMEVKITTVIDEVDAIKFRRMAERAGLSVSDAARIIYTKGLDFFLASAVGATN